MNMTIDLGDRGMKTALVKKSNAVLNDDIERDYTEVVHMDPLIKTY